MRHRLLAAPLVSLALAGCSGEASEAQIEQALAACDATGQARIVRLESEGASPLSVDFDLEGSAFNETAACVRREVEKLGAKAPTMMGGAGYIDPLARPVENPPKIDPRPLNDPRR